MLSPRFRQILPPLFAARCRCFRFDAASRFAMLIFFHAAYTLLLLTPYAMLSC